jgi:hypothetical protein
MGKSLLKTMQLQIIGSRGDGKGIPRDRQSDLAIALGVTRSAAAV